ncbi:hypothetical protein [Arachidicoccus sp.]|uniref:hypothetical protein n=1 Tax=Arachidicoccus sp. TaxID=1872624 RepID=UPI003D1DA2B0
MSSRTIELEIAKKQVANWRKYYAETYNAYPEKEGQVKRKMEPNGEDTYRGFWVSFKDLVELKEMMEKINVDEHSANSQAGIRIYLANKKEQPGDTTSSDMHVLIVPVDASGKDVLELPINANNESSSGSTILDFSSPCPENCDKSSALF